MPRAATPTVVRTHASASAVTPRLLELRSARAPGSGRVVVGVVATAITAVGTSAAAFGDLAAVPIVLRAVLVLTVPAVVVAGAFRAGVTYGRKHKSAAGTQ